ncbi:MAG: DNA alkylation repair protein, partial [Pseudomonadota bacterium]
GALAAFGFRLPELSASIALQTPKVTYGEALAFEVTLSSTGKKPQQLVVDYIVHHQKADGSLSPKPFKWTTFTLAPGEARTLARSHAIKPITTRRYYPGEHRLSLRINGADFGDERFELLMD